MPIQVFLILLFIGGIRRSKDGNGYWKDLFMTRMSIALLVALVWISGCTSDPMSLRSNYRDRNVAPSATQPYSNPPIAAQPGQGYGVTQSAILPQNMAATPYGLQSAAAVQQNRYGFNSPYPMLASAGGQVDGRDMPLLNREARAPRAGGSRLLKRTPKSAASTSITPGISASPQEDLRYRGGHTIKDLKYANVYVGGEKAWDKNDWMNIDKSLAAAMSDRRLNNVIMQYFNNQPVSSQFLGSFFLDGWNPKTVQKVDLNAQVQSLYRQKAFDGFDLPNTVFNFMLPRGVILGDPNGGAQQVVTNKAIPHEEAEDSTGGLGGYHGSVHIGGKTVYYSVGAYSERFSDGRTNGIPVFKDANWKNVVATFYHELQEARTDADVDDAMTSPLGMAVLGWTSDSGNEIGDYPIAEATQLLQVFQEVALADGSGTVPIQLCYSNAVHGPEGPIEYPHGQEPGPGQPNNNPPPNNPPPNNPPPNSSVPPELRDLIGNWNQMEDYIKKAILKLAS